MKLVYELVLILLTSMVLTVICLLLWNQGANSDFVPFRYMFF